jgi:hypothetical protein
MSAVNNRTIAILNSLATQLAHVFLIEMSVMSVYPRWQPILDYLPGNYFNFGGEDTLQTFFQITLRETAALGKLFAVRFSSGRTTKGAR